MRRKNIIDKIQGKYKVAFSFCLMLHAVKRCLSKSSLTRWGLLFPLLYVSFCTCTEAEKIQVPASFSRSSIYSIISYARKKYLDPGRINQNLAYVRASQAALRQLPYSLLLFSKEHYTKRAQWEKGKPLMPGKALFISPKDPYLIFAPDYDKWQKIRKAYQADRKKRYKKLSESERRKIFFAERKQEQKLRKRRIAVWKEMQFSASNFSHILNWIEKHWKQYQELPAVSKKKKMQDAFRLNEIYFAAANGFLHAMDPHCGLLLRGSWKKMLSESEDASFEGIGALLRGGGSSNVVVETPLPGSPALAAGLRAGDIIHKVDGVSIEDMALSEVVKRIRGLRETFVTLHVERPVELRNLDIKIKRGVIKQLAVTHRLYTDKDIQIKDMRAKKVGLIHIKSFLYARKKTSRLVINAYKELMEQSDSKLHALFLDLRGNPGGYLEEAVAVADLFLAAKKEVVKIRGKRAMQALKTKKAPLIKNVPIIVLIDASSASASEILASALMDHNIALVLGEKSFGKATVQSVESSISGAVIKLTSARYYAPKGYTVQVAGVEPDISISSELDASFPPRFREENMWDHLPDMQKHKKSLKRQRWIAKLKKAAGSNKEAEAYIQKHKTDALRPDYMFIRSIAYIKALKRYPRP